MENEKESALPTAEEAARRFDGFEPDQALRQEALCAALAKVRADLPAFTAKFPHVSVHNVYRPEENRLWTASFFPGMAYLAYDLTGDPGYLACRRDYLASFAHRLAFGHTQTHDLGFLYTLSCVADWRLTGDTDARDTALRAAKKLALRYHANGGYIQAWGPMGSAYPDVKIIIDCMMNLPLLYWASETAGDPAYAAMAARHAEVSARCLIRADDSTYHTCLMDPATGRAVRGKTHQGYADESTWARGQAWAVYGFALSYRYTRKAPFLDAARRTARYFLRNLPADFVPYWDFTFTDAHPDIRDSSAAAILACGLLELARWLDGEESALCRRAAARVVESLCRSYTTRSCPASNGLLLHGMYHRDDGADECTAWGDYFYLEALVRLQKDWKPFW